MDISLASVSERGPSVAGIESVCRGFNWFRKNYAYPTEVRAHLQRLGNDEKTSIVAVDLPELYLKRAGAVAEHPATRAGWRFAKLLGELKWDQINETSLLGILSVRTA